MHATKKATAAPAEPEKQELKAAQPEVEAAKERFRKAASDFSPLGIVQRRPFTSLGIAFLAGFGISSLGASKATPPTLDTIAQLAGIAAQFAPLLAARARSSDG